MPSPPADPRPQVVESISNVWQVAGWRCSDCGHPQAVAAPVCLACGGSNAQERFGPQGSVWASTVVRIPAGTRQPPYGLAYIDLDDGPRVLAHTLGDERLPVGTGVTLVAPTPEGDLRVEVRA